jgi:hypothetical protein
MTGSRGGARILAIVVLSAALLVAALVHWGLPFAAELAGPVAVANLCRSTGCSASPCPAGSERSIAVSCFCGPRASVPRSLRRI